MTERLPFALTLKQFIDLPIEDRPPLLGTDGQSLIAAGALTLLGGKAGLGKTTLIVDAIFHLATGLDWLGFTVPRPLNFLVIENEGPMQMFQQKLAAKAKVWPHDLKGQIHVQTGAWGWFTFTDPILHEQTMGYLDEHRIDVVVGDPIGTLGMEGVGSPEDTRNFVRQLVPLGLLQHRAFIFPVHFTKEPRKDEIDQISGAWGGHLDTLMVLKGTGRKDELRLSFPKLRWWNAANPAPMILGKVYNTQTFEILRYEGDQTEPLEQRILAYLADGTWAISNDIAKGISARRADVKKLLESRPDLFRWESGADHGRSARAVVWQPVPGLGTGGTGGQVAPEPTRPGLWDESDDTTPQTRIEPSLEPVPEPWDRSDRYENGGQASNLSQNPPYVVGGSGRVNEPPQTNGTIDPDDLLFTPTPHNEPAPFDHAEPELEQTDA
jgi:hypothetical protein